MIERIDFMAAFGNVTQQTATSELKIPDLDHPVTTQPDTLSTIVSEILEDDPIELPSETQSILPLCDVCEQPIIGPAIVYKNDRTICLDCGNCSVCSSQVTIAEINFCLNADLTIQHAHCRVKTTPNVRIPVDAKELELLNLCRLIIVPDVDLSQETNSNRANLNWSMLWESFTIEQKFLHVQMIETVYQSAYLALKKDPSEVKQQLRERDNKRTTDAHDAARKARTLELPTERKKMDKQTKFLDGMLKSGVSKDDARKIWVSQGRVWME